ncbi:hypothetical protein [Terrisporobacter sp.]|uniref:hypothetical protein n=1 Tax=Terrisporobacter sp. TaxID=1965305 RepID=UPI00289B9052|nr:hypothetical protein [Terrisporobacter sp.]
MGMYCKLLEYEKDLHSWIKNLENERCETDLLNHGKYEELYKLYYDICDEINSYNN